LTAKPKRKRPLGRQRQEEEDNIKINLTEIGCGLESSGAMMKSCECRHEPIGSIQAGNPLT
jgi:hypothetical protein